MNEKKPSDSTRDFDEARILALRHEKDIIACRINGFEVRSASNLGIAVFRLDDRTLPVATFTKPGDFLVWVQQVYYPADLAPDAIVEISPRKA